MNVRKVSSEELHMTLQCHVGVIRDVRARIAAFAKRLGFDADAIYDIELALNEAIANIVKHAYKGDRNGIFELGARLNEATDQLEIMLKDYGEKIDPAAFKSRKLEDYRESGLGIFLMQHLMDAVEYDHKEKDGTRLVMKKTRKLPC